jgi:gas vesicle protein
MSQECNFSTSLLVGFLSGAFVGAAITLLYAPQSGKRFRRDINNKVQDFKEDAGELFSSAKKTACEVVNDGIAKAEHIVSEAKTAADELLTDANRMMSDAKGKVTHAIKTGK